MPRKPSTAELLEPMLAPDPEAEAMLVGYALDPPVRQLVEIAAETLGDDAVVGPLAPVWRVIRSMTLAGTLPTIPEVAAALGPGWPVSRVAALMRDDLGSDDMARATQALVELGRRRRLAAGVRTAMEALAQEGADSATAALESVLAMLRGDRPSDVPRLADLVERAYLKAQKAASERAQGSVPTDAGLPTFIAGLDRATGGMEPGTMWVLAARTSQGKTSLAAQIAIQQTVPVLFVSAEVTADQLGRKVLAARAEIPVPRLRQGFLGERDMERLRSAVEAVAMCQVLVDDHSTSLAAIRASARAAERRYRGLGLIIVDYLQLLAPDFGPAGRRPTRQEEVASISRGLKALAKELHVPVLALAQLSRAAAEDEEPRLSDLRESGAIEQDADVVVMIHRPPAEQPQDPRAMAPTLLLVEKQRDGETCRVRCAWDPASQWLDDLASIRARAAAREEDGRVIRLGRGEAGK